MLGDQAGCIGLLAYLFFLMRFVERKLFIYQDMPKTN